MKKTNFKILLAGSLLVSPLLATAASFDCTKAATQVEKTICANASISKLDDALSAAYQTAKGSSTDSSQLQADQKDWVRARNACKNDECIKTAYETRLSQLRGAPKNDVELKKSVKSKYDQGKEAFEKKDYVSSFNLFNEAMMEGNFEAEHMLGFLYISGQGTTKDLAKGMDLLEKNVKRGNPKGMFTLGQLYYNGAFGVQKDQKRGLELLQSSAKNGNEKAQAELQSLGVKSEGANSLASSGPKESVCPPLDKNPGLLPVDNKAKEVTSKEGLSKFIKNTCDVLKDQMASTVFRKGEVSEFMFCFFSKNELASMLKTRTYEAGITQGEMVNMVNDRCPSFYAKRYDPYVVALQDQQNRVIALKQTEKETAIKKAEQEKVDKIAADKALDDAKLKKETDEKAKVANLLTNAIEKSGVPLKSRIVWKGSRTNMLDDAANSFGNDKKNGLGNIILGDQIKLSGRFVFTPPPKGEFEKTDEYNVRVEKEKSIWNAEYPEDPRMRRLDVLMGEHLGNPMVKDLKYNADKELFNFVIAGQRNNSVSIPGSMQVPRKDAEVFKDRIAKLIPIVVFEFKGDQMIARNVKLYSKDLSVEYDFRPAYTAPLRFNESEAKKIESVKKEEDAKQAAQAKKSPASATGKSAAAVDTAIEALSYKTKPICVGYSKQIEQLLPNRAMYEDQIWRVLENAFNSGCL